ncbi:MAG: prolyl oligopeptidase family serine peptidase [Phycisphaeraceae bacterium]|nr:prolyl oligopeptidase family serine peptidase [Phycisphaeraceae bacterium]MCB9848359.1 prolyl oligopeptidase family serine peptidase [Phycisphaeraceae bacterium]
MIDRFAGLPSSLAQRARFTTLAGVPALVAHPDWESPAPTMLWMHGRTASKELDPGRYSRWLRAGIAAVALDLPGHGERLDRAMHQPDRTLYAVEQMVGEIDGVVEALADPEWGGVFDLDRLGIGGMSAGGMATLRRLCDEHPFQAAAVESTAGDFSLMPYAELYEPGIIGRLDPARHLEGWTPIPLLALHSEIDAMVPLAAIGSFFDKLRAMYTEQHADPDELLTLRTWPETGAPAEHAGFGRVAAEAKALQVEFLERWLGES